MKIKFSKSEWEALEKKAVRERPITKTFTYRSQDVEIIYDFMTSTPWHPKNPADVEIQKVLQNGVEADISQFVDNNPHIEAELIEDGTDKMQNDMVGAAEYRGEMARDMASMAKTDGKMKKTALADPAKIGADIQARIDGLDGEEAATILVTWGIKPPKGMTVEDLKKMVAEHVRTGAIPTYVLPRY